MSAMTLTDMAASEAGRAWIWSPAWILTTTSDDAEGRIPSLHWPTDQRRATRGHGEFTVV